MHDQQTEEWRRARSGKITASRAGALLADRGGDKFASGPRKGQLKPPAEEWMGYCRDIVAEILTGEPRENARARALDWGHDVEAAARAAYEAETGLLVDLSGFVLHRSLPYAGCSPDGLVSADGMVQIKCPANSAVHLATLLDGMPAEHMPQVQFELACTGRAWSDFVSYDPRMPEPQRLYRQRIVRRPDYIAKLEKAAGDMWAHVQVMLSDLRAQSAKAAGAT